MEYALIALRVLWWILAWFANQTLKALDHLFFAPEDRTPQWRTVENNDVQKYVAVYRKENPAVYWGHVFCKAKGDALATAERKSGIKGSIKALWICEWRKLEDSPTCVFGDQENGKLIVDTIVGQLRKDNKVVAKPLTSMERILAPKETAEDKPLVIVPPVTKPRVKAKNVPKPKTYKPPYLLGPARDK